MALQGALTNVKPKSVFITGTNRGIGLNFVKHLLDLPTPPHHIFAACRDPSSAKELQAVAAKKSNVHVLKLDVTDYSALPEVVSQVERVVGEEGLNLLVNNAGINKGDNLETISPEAMREHYEVNSIAPLMVAKAFRPLLKKAAKGPVNASTACIANVSSVMGSTAENDDGKNYAYCSSKCALNNNIKSLSNSLKEDNILTVMLHPGWVQTDMGGMNAMTTKDESVSGLLKVLAAMNQSHSGTFYDFKGKEVPW